MSEEEFFRGVSAACDVIASHGQGVILLDVVETCGFEQTVEEIRKNGLQETKKLLKYEINCSSKYRDGDGS